MRIAKKSQSGMSLVELMVSVVVGLLILAGVVNIFIASRHSMRFSDGLRSMQENGRQAVFVLQNAIQHAGLVEGINPSSDILPIDLGNSGEDKLTIRWQSEFDCGGSSTSAMPDPGIAVDTYYYDSASKQVLCQGNASSTPMSIVDNVEKLAFIYGIDSDDDGSIENYVSHSQVSDEYDVAGVMFGLLVVTDHEVKDQALSKTYTLLNAQLSYNDKKGRQVFTSSVLIRNRGT